MENDAQRQFGETVRQLRKEAGLSQEELARKAGINRTYLSDVERGERNISLQNIVRLATALNTTPGELLSGLPEEHRDKPS